MCMTETSLSVKIENPTSYRCQRGHDRSHPLYINQTFINFPITLEIMLTPLKTKILPLHAYINLLWLQLLVLTPGTTLLNKPPLLVDSTFFPKKKKKWNSLFLWISGKLSYPPNMWDLKMWWICFNDKFFSMIPFSIRLNVRISSTSNENQKQPLANVLQNRCS